MDGFIMEPRKAYVGPRFRLKLICCTRELLTPKARSFTFTSWTWSEGFAKTWGAFQQVNGSSGPSDHTLTMQPCPSSPCPLPVKNIRLFVFTSPTAKPTSGPSYRAHVIPQRVQSTFSNAILSQALGTGRNFHWKSSSFTTINCSPKDMSKFLMLS